MISHRLVLPSALVLASAVLLTACGDDSAPVSGAGAGTSDAPVQVMASFYPLQFVAEKVGGSAVSVANLTAPGAEPHDLELTPQQVAKLGSSELVLYLKDFQPAVDEAVAQQAGAAGFDVSTVTELRPAAEEDAEHDEAAGGEHADEAEGHPEHAGEGDPHVWLEPLRFASIADAVAKRLGEVRPAQAAAFTANAVALRADLVKLDGEFTEGLAKCERKELVTSHDAFGYLADAYGLEQVSLTGLTPEEEAAPATLAKVATFAREHGVTTIFFEDLVSPDVAKALADEVGAEAVQLTPLEGAPASGDYLTAMRDNLAKLRTALGCSGA